MLYSSNDIDKDDSHILPLLYQLDDKLGVADVRTYLTWVMLGISNMSNVRRKEKLF